MTALNPLVTVIIPCFNGEKYVASAIESVLQQTFTKWQLLVVDDGSTDSSAAVIGKIAEKEPSRIEMITTRNFGACHAKNVALRSAATKYVAFLDADDIWLPNKLGLQVSYMEQNGDVVGLTTSYQMISSNAQRRGGSLSFDWSRSAVEDWTLFLSSAPAMNSTLVARREALSRIGGFDESLVSFADDLDLGWRLPEAGLMTSISQNLTLIRISPQQIHRDRQAMNSALSEVYRKLSIREPEIASRALINLQIRDTIGMIREGRLVLGFKRLCLMFVGSPAVFFRFFQRVLIAKL